MAVMSVNSWKIDPFLRKGSVMIVWCKFVCTLSSWEGTVGWSENVSFTCVDKVPVST